MNTTKRISILFKVHLKPRQTVSAITAKYQLNYVSNAATGDDADTRAVNPQTCAVISREFVKSSVLSPLTTGGVANWMQDTQLRFTRTNPLISSSTDGLAREPGGPAREDFTRCH